MTPKVKEILVFILIVLILALLPLYLTLFIEMFTGKRLVEELFYNDSIKKIFIVWVSTIFAIAIVITPSVLIDRPKDIDN